MYLSRQLSMRTMSDRFLQNGRRSSPRWTYDQRTDLIRPECRSSPHQPLQYRDDKRQSLPRTCDSLYDNILVLHEKGYRGRLHRSHLGVAHRLYHIETKKKMRDKIFKGVILTSTG